MQEWAEGGSGAAAAARDGVGVRAAGGERRRHGVPLHLRRVVPAAGRLRLPRARPAQQAGTSSGNGHRY